MNLCSPGASASFMSLLDRRWLRFNHSLRKAAMSSCGRRTGTSEASSSSLRRFHTRTGHMYGLGHLEFFQELCEQVPMNVLLAAQAPQVRHSFRARISSVTQILAALVPETSLLRKRSAMFFRNLFAVDISTKSHRKETFRQHNFEVAYQEECWRENSSE